MNDTSGKNYRDNLVKAFLEIEPPSTDDFLKLKETLTRVGIANHKTKTLYQSCHVLHKKGRYYLVHFKELFALDGKCNSIDEEDLIRRTNVALTLQSWGMLKVINNPDKQNNINIQVGQFTVLKHGEKNDWNLVQKYIVGGSKVRAQQ